MIKIITALLVLYVYAFGNMPTSLFEWNAFQTLFKKIDVNYESKASNKSSIGINPVYSCIELNKEWNFEIGLSYNHYLKELYKGWFLTSRINLWHGARKVSIITATASSISPGIGFGYRWRIGDKFTMSAGLGIGPTIYFPRCNVFKKKDLYIFAIEGFGITF